MTTIWRSFYTIESYTSYNPMSDYCLPLAFYDSALLHLLIGCADSHAARLGYYQKQPVGRKHMYQTIVLMKTRIATLQAVTDETITVVATLAYVEVSVSASCLIASVAFVDERTETQRIF
jgi:Fungal specific transcription factor domain